MLNIEEQHFAPACIITLEHDGQADETARGFSVWVHSRSHQAVQLIPATSRPEAHAIYTVVVGLLKVHTR